MWVTFFLFGIWFLVFLYVVFCSFFSERFSCTILIYFFVVFLTYGTGIVSFRTDALHCTSSLFLGTQLFFAANLSWNAYHCGVLNGCVFCGRRSRPTTKNEPINNAFHVRSSEVHAYPLLKYQVAYSRRRYTPTLWPLFPLSPSLPPSLPKRIFEVVEGSYRL